MPRIYIPQRGLTYHIAEKDKGVIIVKDGTKSKRIMLLSDYVAQLKTGENPVNKYEFLKECSQSQINVLTNIKGRKRFNFWVCLDGEISPEIGCENGIITAKVNNRWRKIQFTDQYQKQSGCKSKQMVLAQAKQGANRLSHAIFHRFASKQNINFIVLP